MRDLFRTEGELGEKVMGPEPWSAKKRFRTVHLHAKGVAPSRIQEGLVLKPKPLVGASNGATAGSALLEFVAAAGTAKSERVKK